MPNQLYVITSNLNSLQTLRRNKTKRFHDLQKTEDSPDSIFDTPKHPDRLSDYWVVQIPVESNPREIAEQHGMKFVRELTIRPLDKSHVLYIFHQSSQSQNSPPLSDSKEIAWFQQQLRRRRYFRDEQADSVTANDPSFHLQWHLHGVPGIDLNVAEAWNRYKGRGINIAVVDDGLDMTHKDISPNYCAACSFDVNFQDSDPTPYSWDTHGTAAAGVATATGNNSVCGVGVSPLASIGGIRLLASDTADYEEAEALNYALNLVDIYSNSWGPYDDGKTLEGPGPLAFAALQNGIQTGR